MVLEATVALSHCCHSSLIDILTNWRPVAEGMVKQLIDSATLELQNIGTDPSTLTPQALLAEISAKLEREWPTVPVLSGFSDVSSARNSREAAEQATAITVDFKRRLDLSLDSTRPGDLLCASEIDAAIGRAFDDVMPMRLTRFYKAKGILREAARDALVGRYKQRALDMKFNAMAELRVALRSSRPGAVADVAAGVVTEAMYECVFPAMKVATALAADSESAWVKARSSAILTEAAEFADARRMAMRKIAQLQDALAIVSGIERYVHANGSASTVSAGQKRPRQ